MNGHSPVLRRRLARDTLARECSARDCSPERPGSDETLADAPRAGNGTVAPPAAWTGVAPPPPSAAPERLARRAPRPGSSVENAESCLLTGRGGDTNADSVSGASGRFQSGSTGSSSARGAPRSRFDS